MRRLYTLLFYSLIPFLLWRLYWKGRRLPAYRLRIKERFGLYIKDNKPVDVWLHAVSVGEVVAAFPLIDALLAQQKKILVTTMTPTGSERVLKQYGGKIQHQYIPYDLPFVLRRFFRNYAPRIGVIMETELWPNLIYEAKRMQIPLLLVNARISDKAFGSYQRVKFLFKSVLNQFTAILAQSEQDKNRFIQLGAAKGMVSAAGNIKFAIQTGTFISAIMDYKKKWGATRPVFIAASTHENEEEQLLQCLPELQNAINNVLFIIVPRHPERFSFVAGLSRQLGFATALRSQPESITSKIEVLIVDSLGELLNFYKLSDYAFVGGSLVPIGGHNVLEPIAMQVPVFCGPYLHNSKAVCEDLLKAGGMQRLASAQEVVHAVITMHKNPQYRIDQIAKAFRLLQENQGVVADYLQKINTVLGNT
ncbi:MULTISPECIES: lipid IV(A) 3-deoxy-D-manno-octulosonic acid transferase [Legionella]|uniref:3-deoxy-D-manno-octulosonic acid transferase n=1 Tax=Legionella septentrionalis TaxID=2498109 RepID=A0A3S0VBS0_9GAMM|nr:MULTISPECIES: lipid IV(A) 3-deoxy-D-manno-octulosonic acid transferase [Legionella]MCP0914080.1 lipid IV(A) 3-deoxy-D-manno-octulosonic acid transferase [Legionella sp. 27cVA30]RUQ90760.1 3-deoxy-D-manno-octulosonic acid transferase [Legionella septentrionalis]RUQ99935.1 3-deoxy-D-manno-octulosonic acid transferase [Legionella septentrionalis]RUR10221.1 3-deoxy-D-manno-octulosonic acid transferase [Legionella septentrionalis]